MMRQPPFFKAAACSSAFGWSQQTRRMCGLAVSFAMRQHGSKVQARRVGEISGSRHTSDGVDAVLSCCRQLREQLLEAQAELRMKRCGRNFRQGREDEPALGKAGMRQGQLL